MPIYDLSIKMQDDYLRRTTKRFKVSAADYATALTNTALFATDLEAISGCDVLSYSLATPVQVTDSVTGGANLDAGATFSLAIVGFPAKKAVTKVPAPEAAIINADGTIDMTDVLVTDYAANFISGFVLVSDGETVDTFDSGRLDR